MNEVFKICFLVAIIFSFSFLSQSNELFSLTITVDDLQNSTGVVQFSLYNTEDCFPDEHYEKEIKQLNAKISNNVSTVTFENIPEGTYAINILHDEDEDGKIKKGWVLPVEGIGFSNLKSINPLNRPSFKKCKFELNDDKAIKVKIIYM